MRTHRPSRHVVHQDPRQAIFAVGKLVIDRHLTGRRFEPAPSPATTRLGDRQPRSLLFDREPARADNAGAFEDQSRNLAWGREIGEVFGNAQEPPVLAAGGNRKQILETQTIDGLNEAAR